VKKRAKGCCDFIDDKIALNSCLEVFKQLFGLVFMVFAGCLDGKHLAF